MHRFAFRVIPLQARGAFARVPFHRARECRWGFRDGGPWLLVAADDPPPSSMGPWAFRAERLESAGSVAKPPLETGPGDALGGARVRLSRVGIEKCAILVALGCLVASTQLPWQTHARQPALLPCGSTICPCHGSGARTRESPREPSRHVTGRSFCHPEVDLFCSSHSTPQHPFPAPHFERKKSRRHDVEFRENTADLIRDATRARHMRRSYAQ